MSVDLTEVLKAVSRSASESYRSGYCDGYDRGYADGLRAGRLLVTGKSVEDARAETYRNLPRTSDYARAREQPMGPTGGGASADATVGEDPRLHHYDSAGPAGTVVDFAGGRDSGGAA